MLELRGRWLTTAFAVLLFSTGCEREAPKSTPLAPGEKLKVVATIFPLADWAAKVGGEHVEVTTLLPAGQSPHTFSEQPSDVKAISQAGLFLKVGLEMDDWGANLTRATNVKVLSLGDVLREAKQLPDPHDLEVETSIEAEETTGAEDGHGHDHDHHNHDHTVNPHFWLSPQVARAAVLEIGKQLAEAAPQYADTFRGNAAAYVAELQQVDMEIGKMLAGCKGKSFVTFHDAFPYFAHHYGLKIAAVIEEYPGKNPPETYVKQVTRKLQELGVKTVFSEPQLDARVAEIIATEIKGSTDVLDPYGDPSYKDRNSYVELLRYNARKLKQHLCP